MSYIKRFFIILLAVLALPLVAVAKIWLPQMFQNGMVLQRNQTVNVWGTAEKGESIIIKFCGKNYTTVANGNGQWSIQLPKMKAGGPYEMTLSSSADDSVITISDVMVGDVWLCSGQSNIDVTIERVYPQYREEIDNYKNDNIRLFRVYTDYSTTPRQDVKPSQWRRLSKQDAWQFSAVGYFLARKMYEKTGVPQGIICNSLGGSPIQAWIPLDSVRQIPRDYYDNYFLYTDSQYVAAQSVANQRANDVWFEQLNQTDPGVKENWTSPLYNDAQWTEYDQYDNAWAKSGGNNVIGTIYMRQHITIDKEHAGKKAQLLLGTLFDMDYTFVNGQQVGVTYYQYPPRRYEIPEGLLREGDNVITVRFVNKYGMAHFIKDKPYKLVFADNYEIALGRQWKSRIGRIMPPMLGGKLDTQNQASVLHNGMLMPIAPYSILGVVWYQGESNTNDPSTYGTMLRMLKNNWRSRFTNPELPFAVVQLANFMEPSAQPQNSSWAALREQQRRECNADNNAELVVGIDLGEAVDIHPLLKKEVAERCALALENMAWSKHNTLFPQVTSSKVQNGQVTITMNQALQEGELYEFELAASDGKYHNAKATAKGNIITIACENVPTPVSVRYAWKDNPDKANCRGLKNNLPASPFEIDTLIANQ
ncbi:MAG: sialate O-acetylesterase [Prevotella sp.]|nr:sialate O-acetylesterase [Prevotella sp.]